MDGRKKEKYYLDPNRKAEEKCTRHVNSEQLRVTIREGQKVAVEESWRGPRTFPGRVTRLPGRGRGNCGSEDSERAWDLEKGVGW